MKVMFEFEDHGGVSQMLKNLSEVYQTHTPEATLERAVDIVTVLAKEADEEGVIHFLDCSLPGPETPFAH